MAPTTTGDIVAKLWNLCNVLKDDGVTDHQYVSELTYLLFLKLALETGQEQGLSEEWRWGALEALQGLKQLEHNKLMLLELGSSGSGASPLVHEIYANASSFIKKPTTLNKLVSAAKPSRRGGKKAQANPDQLPLDAAPAHADRLTSLLRECGALSERALLAPSELNPARYRAQLALELAQGAIRESSADGQVWLEASG